MKVWYNDEMGRQISYQVKDEDSLYSLAQLLLDAPIDLDCLYSEFKTFNLNTFEWC